MMLAFRTVHLSKLCLLRVVTEQRQRWRPGNYTVRSSCLSVAFWAFTYLGRKFPWSESIFDTSNYLHSDRHCRSEVPMADPSADNI